MHGNPRRRNEELLQMAELARRQKEAGRATKPAVRMGTVTIEPHAAVKLSLRASKFFPGRVFTFQNQLNMDVRIVVDGREIRLEQG